MDYQSFAQAYIDDRLLKAEKMRQISELTKYKNVTQKGLMKYFMKFACQIGLFSNC